MLVFMVIEKMVLTEDYLLLTMLFKGNLVLQVPLKQEMEKYLVMFHLDDTFALSVMSLKPMRLS